MRPRGDVRSGSDAIVAELTTPVHLDTGTAGDHWVSRLIPRRDDVTSPCWRFIDRYGDTYFNRQLLPALAEFALALPHRYLRFSGD